MLSLTLIAWALLAMSVLDTVVMLWLGATILLNAERRTWGVWLVGGALLMGGGFFICHAALLGQSAAEGRPALQGWWMLGWVPGLLLPLAWYVAMLWHAGYWGTAKSALHRRHRRCLPAAVGLGAAVLGISLHSPLVMAGGAASRIMVPRPLTAIAPVAILYPVYLLFCIGLSLDVLAHPGPATRMMGDLARHRARPWLVATSVVLLVVSLTVGGALPWLALQTRTRSLDMLLPGIAIPLAWADLFVASLITASVLLLGQAVVSYEIFTGKALPRRGLRRQWHSAVALGACYGAVAALTFASEWPAIAGLLLATVAAALLYALAGWRTFAERERSMRHLRPFVNSAHLYDALLGKAPTDEAGAESALRALCVDVLGARVAYLQATGSSAPLFGPALAHPEGTPVPAGIERLAGAFARPESVCAPVDPARFGGAVWAVPLWSRGGVSGILLLSAKGDDGLYTQEEMEVARAAGERIIDLRASATIAERLMALQRQRLAEAQLLDQRSRRVLHDEVLPRLHAAILALSTGDAEAARESVAQLSEAHRDVSALLRSLPVTGAPVARLGLVEALRRVIQEEMPDAFASVEWQVDAAAEEKLRALPAVSAEVLFHAAREAIRNAARYARGNGEHPVSLRVAATAGCGLAVVVEDNGVGIGPAEGGQGSGQGLAMHGTMMAVIGGELSVETAPGAYTRVRLTLPEIPLMG